MEKSMPEANRGECDTPVVETAFPAVDAARERPKRSIALIAAAIKTFRRDKERARNLVESGIANQGGHAWRTSLRRYW